MEKNTFLTTTGILLNIKCSECARWTGITNPPQTERNHWYCSWCGRLLKQPSKAGEQEKIVR